MRLKCRVVNGGSGRCDSAVTTRCAKRVEASVFAAQERGCTCAALNRVDKRIETFTSHVRLGGILKDGRGASRGGGGRGE